MLNELRALADRMRAEQAPPRLEAELLESFRRHARRRARARWMRSVAAAVAAAVGIVFLTIEPRASEPPSPAPAARREVASDFFSLRPGPVVEAGEFAPMVRVTLPRSAMGRFGLPVPADPRETVQADVILGHDGMARAVRFISFDTGNR